MADKRPTLKVDKRDIVGKKVKKLRREGILPATIYGKDIKSLSVQVMLKEFEKIHKEVRETGLVDLTLDSEKTHPVLIKNVQLDPKTSLPIHADFYQVNLTEKIRAHVPVEPVGEPKAVVDKIGILEVPLSEIEVEALPTDLPEKIEVDVANLANIDDQITVADVKVSTGVTIVTEPGQILFKIGELVTKEAEELAKAEEAAAAAAAAEAAVAAGETPAAAAEGEEAPAEAAGEKPAEGEKPASATSDVAGKPAEAKPEEKKE